MLSVWQVWLPILGSAIGVFVASSLVHMVLKCHNSDYRKLSNEDEARALLRPATPGMYFVPHCADMKELQKPENIQKFVEGPVAMITIRPSGKPSMGKPLMQWFLLNLFVSVIAGYVATKMVVPGASFLAVCRPISTITFMSYAAGSLSAGIWTGRSWPSVMKELGDAAIYAAVAACIFAWLWPGAPQPY
jgi:hypothetical protein